MKFKRQIQFFMTVCFHFLKKTCTSVVGLLVIACIFCGIVVYDYSNENVERVNNLETNYRHIYPDLETNYNSNATGNDVQGNSKNDDLTKALVRISQNNKYTILVSVISRGYMNLTYNWLCNTRKWGIHSQVLFIVFDKQTEVVLKRDWPEVTSIYFDGIEETRGFAYGTVGYARIVLKRVKIMVEIIQHDVKMFLFETDSVWFRNPMPYLDNVTKGYDIAVTKVSKITFDAVEYCLCFLYIYPTRVMKTFWDKMLFNMTSEQERIKSLDDKSRYHRYPAFSMQKVFSDLINQRYADVHYLVLPEELFPDGNHYMTKSKIIKETNAYLLHNNFIQGNDWKMQRAKNAEHWFLKDDMTCKN